MTAILDQSAARKMASLNGLAASSSALLPAIILLAIETAMRRGEIVSLQ